MAHRYIAQGHWRLAWGRVEDQLLMGLAAGLGVALGLAMIGGRVRVLRALLCGHRAVLAAMVILLLLGATKVWIALERSLPGDLRANVVLITVDTLRADHLGCYGHERATSPQLDRMALEGVRFESALSQAPWTLPSMASLHTSLYPSQHGAIGMKTVLGSETVTLAEVLQNAGYWTSAVVTHKFVGSRYGFEQGFEAFDERFIVGHKGLSSEQVTTAVLEQIEAGLEEPFFLWAHYFDPHFSYVQHDDWDFASGYEGQLSDPLTVDEIVARTPLAAQDVAHIKAVYDEEIAFTDREIGRLLDGVRGLGSERATVSIVTADHGEAFFERGKFGHGGDLYRELTHVPLLIAGSIDESLRGTVVKRPVEVASIAATILALARVESSVFQGEDLLATVADGSELRPSFTEGSYARGDGAIKLATVIGEWKLIRDLRNGREELYHVTVDPDERNDLVDGKSAEVFAALQRLREAMNGFERPTHGAQQKIDLDPAEVEHLRALGYAE
ncbi:MAG: arylsulfatase A-like enzyme [Chlamydiales bacterium]|jgi:arylsulfatase A-like enzyme